MPPSKKKAKGPNGDPVAEVESSLSLKSEHDDTSSASAGALSLEQIRSENMKRNSDFLADLGLDQDKTSWRAAESEKVSPTRRGQGPKKAASSSEPIVMRRSGRITSERLKSEIQNLKSDKDATVDPSVLAAKEVELEAMQAKKYENSYQAFVDAENTDEYNRRLPADPISLLSPSNFGSAETENAGRPLISVLRKESAYLPASSASSAPKADSAYLSALRRLSVAQQDVAKMTESRVTAVAFHPSTSKVLAMAGDKLGYIGIWDVNSSASEVTGGVYRYKPHSRNIATIHSWNSDPSKVYTTSYDGTVRYIDLDKESFCQCFEAPESIDEIIFSDTSFSPHDSHSLLVGRSDGCLCNIDLREAHSHRGRNSYAYNWSKCAQEGSKLNSVQFHPSQEHLVICGGSGKFGSITIHDMRKSGPAFKPLYQHDLHDKSINASYVSPDGEYIVSVSLDNTVRATSNYLSSNPTSTMIRHDNHTGRWLSTFRPAFDPKRENAFVLGSMDKPRRVEFYNIGTGSSSKDKKSITNSITLLHAVQTEWLASVCSRNCFHPSLDIIAAANSSGRVHIVR